MEKAYNNALYTQIMLPLIKEAYNCHLRYALGFLISLLLFLHTQSIAWWQVAISFVFRFLLQLVQLGCMLPVKCTQQQ